MREGQVFDIRCPMANFVAEITGLFCKWRSVRVDVYVDKATKFFDLDRIEADILNRKIRKPLRLGRTDKLAIQPIGPRMICLLYTSDAADE